MQAGHLYEMLSIQQKSVAKGTSYGEEVVTWVNFAANIRANQTDLNGAEAVRQNLRVGSRGVKVTIRWRAGITTDMRILQTDGRIFQIVSATEIPRKRGLELMCEEYTA